MSAFCLLGILILAFLALAFAVYCQDAEQRVRTWLDMTERKERER